ncbi:hypothetical protein A9P82_12585 [Arachidicoccus ginsenosidimutans]|uniref:putative sugar nucleotidyl transferase n=1 Tax=Arachidicoccus sp. BS20 TaxID=1850526 RepID=UPI0007F0B061|nr:putative sugar nucleotidyl transferase [Arachidicoccus sp. BS20]ANI90046.1 hypothetical protein A9P82_12585 [Arachidicoccus sp. BS20]
MVIILFEEQAQREKFYPLTFTKPFAELHAGIFSIKEWWEKFTKQKVISSNEILDEQEETIYINAHLLPNENIWNEIQNLKTDEPLKDNNGNTLARKTLLHGEKFLSVKANVNVDFIETPQQLLQHHAKIIEQQFHLIIKEKPSQKISSTNNIIKEENIFVDENVEMEYATLNAKEGFIYIGANAVVMEGSAIRSAFALGENSVVKMGAKIYGAVSTGRKCTLGGEIKNTIFQHCSNKAHDGYLGDSIIGSWCNFGAGATNSNVKNTASNVGVYDYHSKQFLPTTKKFGVLLGDYSRVAINSSINTGSSIGAACNVFGAGLLPKFIPNFSWGVDEKYEFEKAVEHINNWMAFKQEQLSEDEIQTLKHIFETLDFQ